jgi:ubiquinone/menaquinone biosynthesis C-methylase UbiE
MHPSDPAYAGQRHYTPGFLKAYDLIVLGIFGPLVWRCPTSRLVAHYGRHVGRRPLAVGPGTGYFIERARLPSNVRVLLVDPNPNVLRHAARRLGRLSPSVLQADILKPLPVDGPFDAVALNYVLHCLPGPMARKAAAIQNAAAVLDTQGTVFGATVLGTPALHTSVYHAWRSTSSMQLRRLAIRSLEISCSSPTRTSRAFRMSASTSATGFRSMRPRLARL